MSDINMSVNIAGVELKNPVTVASGTFGSGMEYGEYVDLNRLGAVTTKGVANIPWPGNPTPRIAETYGGMMNAIGLQNPGLDTFVKRDIPFLKQYDTKIIVNVCGKSEADYVDAVEKLGEQPVDLLEINISCPNVKEGGIAFGQVPSSAEAITKAVKKVAKQPVIMKLSPNVTDITEMAKAVEAGGADVVIRNLRNGEDCIRRWVWWNGCLRQTGSFGKSAYGLINLVVRFPVPSEWLRWNFAHLICVTDSAGEY